MRRLILVVATVIGGLFLAANVVLAADYPQPTGYVNDFADIISAPVQSQLEKRLSDYTASTSNELAVVTLPSLQGDTVENAAVDIFSQWGIGQKEKDNGVLLLIAVEDHAIRIEVGYGLEPVLTDSRAGNIIREEISPAFKAGDYDAGIVNGTEAIINVLGKDPTLYDQPESTSNAADTIGVLWFGGIILFMYTAAFLSRSKRYWPGGVIGLILGLILAGAFAGLGLGLLGLLLDYTLSKNYKVRKAKGLPTSWWTSGGGFSSGSSSGGFGGFSGGSSGGGGASGGW